MARKRIKERENAYNSNLNFLKYKNLALNMFKYENLPNGIEEEIIEETLFSEGQALFFNDNLYGFMVLPCYGYGGLNFYSKYNKYRAVGLNYSKVYKKEESVLIKNNNLCTDTFQYIVGYTEKITNIENTLNVNLFGQNTPYLVQSSDNTILSMKNIHEKRASGELAIYVDKSMNIDSLKVHMTPTPFLLDKLSDYKTFVINELLTFLGINNANTDKRERLVTDEVNSNNDFIKSNANIMLKCREKAVDDINKMFGLNIKVSLRNGGGEVGTVYNDIEGTSGE